MFRITPGVAQLARAPNNLRLGPGFISQIHDIHITMLGVT